MTHELGININVTASVNPLCIHVSANSFNMNNPAHYTPHSITHSSSGRVVDDRAMPTPY